MLREAILHIPMSQYAHGIDERHLVFRIRSAKGDLTACTLYYADRACRVNPVLFTSQPMRLAASDTLYDYFEVVLEAPYTRVCYYFELSDGQETILYYADQFTQKHADERSEYYQFPFNHRNDIAEVPAWLKEAVVYNIFPDSFATSKEYIAEKAKAAYFNATVTTGQNGGTLRGIADNITYLLNLGINCIYVNPIFAAEEYHKYDLLDYYHIDPCFGTNEDFKVLVDSCHKSGIRVIIDGVFNHCGWHFFAFEDVVQNGENSRYKDWFYRLTYPVVRPDNGEEIPNYDCFAYERKMPKLNTANPEVEQYFCDVGRYWVKEFDIDGWRLDVANEVNFDFWRAFRRAVKAVKPDCVLIGEVWESAQPWLRGDMFDSSMNYDLRKNCRDFFALEQIDADGFDARVTAMRMRYTQNILYGQLNLLDSHDVSRFFTLCGEDKARFKLAVIFQMTFVGIPSVFYGDEKGLAGRLEHEYRRPMYWGTDESGLFQFYQRLIAIRKQHQALIEGGFKTISAEKGSGLYAYERANADETIVILLNASSEHVEIGNFISQGQELLAREGLECNSLSPYGYTIFKR
ncbi:glycoside hydrolase family 13 protein [Acetanaerobacterium elongatum]|uniref:Glycosidase n=1 Tax=Acetanaerobacterium elongatum TaxID=258515 RepID=A0A1G9W1F9_9FIRM|nr:glycoside hydrolase family 13 protein [Acetanaerobacterium elongatum]SDM78359.1 Glycosidase [Acetanaerobacterium elongatum]